jgi:ribonuclease P protein component
MGLEAEWQQLGVEKLSIEDVRKEENVLVHKQSLFGTIKKRSQFLYIKQQGYQMKGKYTILQYICHNADILCPLFGLTVSKKVGNAVERNLVKRRLRAVIRSSLSRIGEAKNISVVIIAKPNILQSSYQELASEIEYFYHKIVTKLYHEKKNVT